MKVVKNYTDEMLGFPVVFDEVFVTNRYGHIVPLIDYEALQHKALELLADKPGRLTGPEIRFIRKYSGMTLARFGNQFGVKHSAVKKWEDGSATMNWGAEALLRLLTYRASGKASVDRLLESLATPRTGESKTMKVCNAEVNRNVTRLLDPTRDAAAIAYIEKRGHSVAVPPVEANAKVHRPLVPPNREPKPRKKQPNAAKPVSGKGVQASRRLILKPPTP